MHDCMMVQRLWNARSFSLLILFLLTDIFKHGIWPELDNISDPELRELAEYLPLVALQSRAPSTAKKYAGAFCRWRTWAATKPQVDPFPAKPIHVGLYLSYLIQKANTSSPVEEAVNALSWAHNLACVEDPTGHPLVKQVLKGAKRILAHKTDKEPITLTICLLGFAGFSDASWLRSRSATCYFSKSTWRYLWKVARPINIGMEQWW